MKVKEVIEKLEKLNGDIDIKMRETDTDGCSEYNDFVVCFMEKDEPEDEEFYYIW